MLHIFKHLSKREREEYEHWLAAHQRSLKPVTAAEQAMADKSFWAREAEERARRSRRTMIASHTSAHQLVNVPSTASWIR